MQKIIREPSFDNDIIFVVIPTYNEAENLPVLAAEIWALNIPKLSIIVVDDNSPDGTADVAQKMAERRPDHFFLLSRKHGRNLGSAYISGFQFALQQGADYVIQMDCDLSHSPKYIPEMLAKIEKADVVIGSRYVAGGKLDEHWGTSQYFASWWANNVYLRLILNLQVKDATTGYKCWRADALQSIDLDSVCSNGYSFQFEMAYLAEKLGYEVVEIPISFEDRRIGDSRLGFPSVIEAALRTWQFRWRYRQYNSAKDSSDHENHWAGTGEA